MLWFAVILFVVGGVVLIIGKDEPHEKKDLQAYRRKREAIREKEGTGSLLSAEE